MHPGSGRDALLRTALALGVGFILLPLAIVVLYSFSSVAYGVFPPDAPPERQFARRWTFYIDPTGKIADIDRSVKPATSGQDVVTHLEQLKVPTK